MRLKRIGWMGAVAGVVFGGLVAVAGCVGADDTVSGGDQAELQSGFRSHRRHRGPDAGSAGTTGTTGTTSITTDGGAVTDCDVCTQAQQCCEAVAPGDPVCSFSATNCSSMVGDARPAYVNACLTFLVAGRGARVNPPAECR